jgi:hypothetical protein
MIGKFIRSNRGREETKGEGNQKILKTTGYKRYKTLILRGNPATRMREI